MFPLGKTGAHDQTDIPEAGNQPPEAAANSDQESPEEQAPQYVTRQDLEAFHQAIQRDLRRLSQSNRDRTRDLRQKFSQSASHYARAAEVAVSRGFVPANQKDAYAKALQDQAMLEAMTEEVPTPPPGQRRQQQPAPNPADYGDDLPDETQAADINAEGERLAAQLGLKPGDPELEHVIIDGTPDEFLASIRVAARIKAKRSQTPGNQQPPARKPAGRNLANGGGGATRPPAHNPIENISSADELFDLAWKQKKAAIRGG